MAKETDVAATPARTARWTEGEDLVAATLARHATSLLATARRHSLCEDDAHDAYQRAMETFLRNAGRLDPERAHRWLHTVVKHEAISLRADRQRVVPRTAYDFDAQVGHEASPDDRALDRERAGWMAEALEDLRPGEEQALRLRADGLSYTEIAGELGWTRTKVNRSLTEGRARARTRFALLESGRGCERWAPTLERLREGGAAAPDLAGARRHLRICPACRATVRAMHDREAPMAGIAPLGLVGFVAWWQERAVSATVRVQMVAETLMSAKGMAVAASAAALTSGGVAAVDRLVEPPSRATAAPVHSARPAAQGPAARTVEERAAARSGPGARSRTVGTRSSSAGLPGSRSAASAVLRVAGRSSAAGGTRGHSVTARPVRARARAAGGDPAPARRTPASVAAPAPAGEFEPGRIEANGRATGGPGVGGTGTAVGGTGHGGTAHRGAGSGELP
ncbi:RNA polymerase sigma factor [Paraconexibacter sp.]|uniref:RNA polymerase sigma factor n=1 Tax=Paraconexibacter sp. TaxID=2949640 RepID=UPI0035681635